MPARCVVGGCSNTRNLQEGIGLHTLPLYGDDRPEAKNRRTERDGSISWKRNVRGGSRLRARWFALSISNQTILLSHRFMRFYFYWGLHICKVGRVWVFIVLPHHVWILWKFTLKVTSAPTSSRTIPLFIESWKASNSFGYNNNIRWSFEEKRRYNIRTLCPGIIILM